MDRSSVGEAESAMLVREKLSRSPWVLLGVAYLLMVYFAFPLQSLPPLLGDIAAEVGLSNFQAGVLMGAYGIPGLVMPLAAAALAVRFDNRDLIIASLGVMAVGVALFAGSSSFLWLFAGRVLAGLGAKVILTMAPLLVALSFDGSRLGFAVGVFDTAVPLGSVLALNAFGVLGDALGWRLASWMLVPMALLLALLVRGTLRVPKALEARGGRVAARGGLGWNAWFLAVVNLLVNAVTLAYLTFAPGFFLSAGLSHGGANWMASLLVLEAAVVGPLAGFIIGRRGGHRTALLVAGIVTALSFFMLAVRPPPSYFWSVLLGVGAAVVPVMVFPLLKSVLPTARVPMGLAVLIIASNFGGALGPTLFGWFLDWGGYQAAFRALAAASVFLVPVACALRLPAGGAPRSGGIEVPPVKGDLPRAP